MRTLKLGTVDSNIASTSALSPSNTHRNAREESETTEGVSLLVLPKEKNFVEVTVFPGSRYRNSRVYDGKIINLCQDGVSSYSKTTSSNLHLFSFMHHRGSNPAKMMVKSFLLMSVDNQSLKFRKS